MEHKHDYIPGQGADFGLCHTAGHAAIKTFCQMLEDWQHQMGRTVTIEDVRILADEFMVAPGTLRTFYRRIFDDCASAQERAFHVQQRRNPFFRLIVHSFSHLFADRSSPGHGEVTLNRDILPSFFVVLRAMLGPDRIERDNEACREIVDTLRGRYGEAFCWDMFYEDRLARCLVDEALISIASHFNDFGRRAEWFVYVMNHGGLSLASGRADDAVRTRDRFTKRHFLLLAKNLFGRLGEGCGVPANDSRLNNRLGEFFLNLERLEADLACDTPS